MNRRTDAWLIAIVSLLLMLGLVMVYSASAVVATDETGSATAYLVKQGVAALVGGAVCIGAAITPMASLRRYRWWLYGAVLVGLALCFVPGIAYRANGASRWLGLGPVHLQPSAFAKITVLVMLADFLATHRGRLHDLRTLGYAALLPLPAVALILPEPDFGTTAITVGLCLVMCFVAGVRWMHMGAAVGLLAALGVPLMVAEQYRLRRLLSFRDPWSAMDGDGYHIIQSWIAMHSGGLWGQGLGNSMSKLHFLPEPWTDFIASVIAEELGLITMLGLIALYALLAWRGLHIARHARNAFSSLLAATITAMICGEAALNLGVIMGLLPPKGLVLPFISYGASQLIAHLWCIGMLLSIAAESEPGPVVAWRSAPAGGPTPSPAPSGAGRATA